MSFTESELSALRRAYASGVTEVTYDGKTTRYDSGAALLERIRVIEADAAAAAAGNKKHVAGFAAFRRS